MEMNGKWLALTICYLYPLFLRGLCFNLSNPEYLRLYITKSSLCRKCAISQDNILLGKGMDAIWYYI